MKTSSTNLKRIMACICSLTLLGCLQCNCNAQADTNLRQGTQLAFFVGYHSGGMQNGAYPVPIYSSPKYHHRGRYKSNWTSRGHNCHKTCVLDRWTGKSLSCHFTC